MGWRTWIVATACSSLVLACGEEEKDKCAEGKYGVVDESEGKKKVSQCDAEGNPKYRTEFICRAGSTVEISSGGKLAACLEADGQTLSEPVGAFDSDDMPCDAVDANKFRPMRLKSGLSAAAKCTQLDGGHFWQGFGERGVVVCAEGTDLAIDGDRAWPRCRRGTQVVAPKEGEMLCAESDARKVLSVATSYGLNTFECLIDASKGNGLYSPSLTGPVCEATAKHVILEERYATCENEAGDLALRSSGTDMCPSSAVDHMRYSVRKDGSREIRRCSSGGLYESASHSCTGSEKPKIAADGTSIICEPGDG